MKKLFAVAALLSLGIAAEMSAKHRMVSYDVSDCPVPCCEKQEMITVRKPAELVCGYVCPTDTNEVE